MALEHTPNIEQAVRHVMSEILSEVSEEIGSSEPSDGGNGGTGGGIGPRMRGARPGALSPPPGIPSEMLDALEDVCNQLSADQASTLAEFFEAIANKAEEGPEEPEEAEEGFGARSADALDLSPEEEEAAAASKVGGPISRSEVLARAMFWVRRKVPYSMSKFYPDPQKKKYRTDCSGFVAMALHLAESPNTVTLPTYVKRIRWSSLRKGDIVGTLGAGTGGANGHVVIFNGWANSDHTQFHTIEQRGGHGAVKHARPINFPVGSHAAKPYRYKKIISSSPRSLSPI